MAAIHVSAEGPVGAPPDTVYGYLADMQTHHPKFLPPAFSEFRVESGGVGAGTIISYNLAAGGRTRSYRSQVAEPEPGRTLTESDMNSSAVTTFTVVAEGGASRGNDRQHLAGRKRARRLLRETVRAARAPGHLRRRTSAS